MKTLFVDWIIIGAIRGLVSRWFGDELTRRALKPVGRFLKSLLIRTEHQARLWAHYRHGVKHPATVSEIDSVTI